MAPISSTGGTEATVVTTNTTAAVDFENPIVESAPEPPAAVPLDQVQTHQDPFEAAKELRTLVRHAREASKASGGGYAEEYATDARIWLARTNDHLTNIEQLLPQLMEAVNERKAVRGRELLEALTHNIGRLRVARSKAADFNHHSIAAIKKGVGPGVVLKDLERMGVLIQSLPTVPGMPSTPAENILMSIASLMKVGGFLKGGDGA